MAILPSALLRPPDPDRRRSASLTTRALTHLRQAHLTSQTPIATAAITAAAAAKSQHTHLLLVTHLAAAANHAHDSADPNAANEKATPKFGTQPVVATNSRRPAPSGLPVARDFQTPSPPPADRAALGRGDGGGGVRGWCAEMPRTPRKARGVVRAARMGRGRWRLTEGGSPVGFGGGDDDDDDGGEGLVGEGEEVVERFLVGRREGGRGVRRWLEGEFGTCVGGRGEGDGSAGVADGAGDEEGALGGSETSSSSELMRDPWDWESLVDAALDAVMASPAPRPAVGEVAAMRKRYVSENWIAYSPLASASEDGADSDGNGCAALQSRSTSEVDSLEPYDSDATSEEEEHILGIKGLKDRMPWRKKVGSKTAPQPPEANVDGLDTFASTPATLLRKNRFEGLGAFPLRSVSDWPTTPKKPNKPLRKTTPHTPATASPTFQTIRAGALPLSQGFQVNLCSEDMEDPFVEPVKSDPGPSIDEMDDLLTKVWDAYNDGNPRSREVLLMRLRQALVEQEILA